MKTSDSKVIDRSKAAEASAIKRTPVKFVMTPAARTTATARLQQHTQGRQHQQQH